MSKRISYEPDDIEAVGDEVCPDIANFYDEAGSKAATAGRGRDSAFGAHGLTDTWGELYDLFYKVVYESGENIRAMGPTLKAIAEDQRILEGELAQTFEQMEGEISGGAYAPQATEHFEDAPRQAPDPAHKDYNPYDRFLDGTG
ncbi:hypothetical protein [Glycomyces sp. YM15]|uniref:hypothetical protein n=1 Tax=Glycomyces sp. YM15 TaxID=2800446 RepID=UPI0019634E48|nr:hypothetical protein [Glycomyces sp. YM15]